jgi:hypothetical protein
VKLLELLPILIAAELMINNNLEKDYCLKYNWSSSYRRCCNSGAGTVMNFAAKTAIDLELV